MGFAACTGFIIVSDRLNGFVGLYSKLGNVPKHFQRLANVRKLAMDFYSH